jgi:ketosteroid isomerase-like protein
MSRENVEAARHWIDAYNRRDMEGLIGLTDPDFQFRSYFVGIESLFHGHEGLQTYFAQLDDAYESFQVVAREVFDAGAAVLMVAQAEWCGKGSGATGVTPVFPTFWLRAGKVLRGETFSDRSHALQAVGLRE